MNVKQKFGYTLLGGVIAVIGMLIGIYQSPLAAQDGKFGEITCTGLKVMDAYGEVMTAIGNDKYGGLIVVTGKDGKPGVLMGIEEEGGRVDAIGKDGKSSVRMTTTENGGVVGVWDKYGTLRLLD